MYIKKTTTGNNIQYGYFSHNVISLPSLSQSVVETKMASYYREHFITNNNKMGCQNFDQTFTWQNWIIFRIK